MAPTHTTSPTQEVQPKERNLLRAASDLFFELTKEVGVVDSKCECCGMSEECTPKYIKRVRRQFCGKWLCGLCSEAVKEMMEKDKVGIKEAVFGHMNFCAQFNRIGRSQPLLGQAVAMGEILKKFSTSSLEKGGLKGSKNKVGGIMRTSSCMPAIIN